MRSRKVISLSAAFLIATAAALPAQDSKQESAPKPPRREAKKGDFLRFPLGPIGGQGEVLADQSTIKILSVSKDGPGEKAGLAKGDMLIGAMGIAFNKHTRNINDLDGPMRELGIAIEAAEVAGHGLRILTGKQVELRIDLPKLGPLQLGIGKASDKALKFYDGICSALLSSRRKNGSWRANTGEDASRYVTALCGLALLGRGNPAHRDALANIAAYLAGPEKRGHISVDMMSPAGLSNWFITMSGIYLSEYVLATGDKQWLPTIQHISDCLAARQTKDGRYGHGITVGYSGKGLNIINTHAHLLWALADRAGAKINENKWQNSLAEIKKSTGDNGGVRYWTLQTGYWDSCARTGQMALALSLRNESAPLALRMANYLVQHRNRMREAHATGSIGMIFGTNALRRLDADGWLKHLETWRWYLNLMRQPDYSAKYVGGKRNNGGDSYLRPQHIAHAIAGTMLASSLGHLHMSGNNKTGWLPKD
jgi:hypothetical protein